MAHQLPRLSPPDSGAGLSDTKPAQQHQGDGGFSPLHRLRPPASGRFAAVPTASASSSRRPPTGGGVGYIQRKPGDPVHHRVHGHDSLPGLGSLRQLSELQESGADHRLRLRDLLLSVHAGVAVHGPDLCAQSQHSSLAGGTNLPVGGQHPGYVLGGRHMAHLLAQIQTGS